MTQTSIATETANFSLTYVDSRGIRNVALMSRTLADVKASFLTAEYGYVCTVEFAGVERRRNR